MKTSSIKSEQLTTIYIKAISNNIDSWANELYIYLKKYGISEKKCRQIARRRAMYAIDCLEREQEINIFYNIIGTKHAVSIYNAFIRHEKTNYDRFCESVNASICKGSPLLDGIEMKKLWRLQCPAQFEKYEKACIFIGDDFRRISNGHFVY